MEYLDTNAELKRQVTTLQKYLMQVVEHSEMEVQDHEINERIWRKEKMQLNVEPVIPLSNPNWPKNLRAPQVAVPLVHLRLVHW